MNLIKKYKGERYLTGVFFAMGGLFSIAFLCFSLSFIKTYYTLLGYGAIVSLISWIYSWLSAWSFLNMSKIYEIELARVKKRK